MPPKARFRNKNRNKSNQNQKQNHNNNASHTPNQHQKNRGRSRSRSRKPFQKPPTPRLTTPRFPTPASPYITSKATHTLRTTLFHSPTGVLKRRISIGLSITLPSNSASNSRLKNLLLHTIDDARGCVGNMDWESCGPENDARVEVPINTSKNGGDEDPTFRDSGIGMDTSNDEGPWEAEQSPLSEMLDHGCVDIVREHGQLVERMRWTSESTSYVDVEPPSTPGKMSQWTKVRGGRGGTVRPNRSSYGARNEEGCFVGWDDEVM